MPQNRTRAIGAWLFHQRSWLPVPIALALMLARPTPHGSALAIVTAGLLLVAGGEALRVWAVRHIGAISRTRAQRLGPLVERGPFFAVRNPLYLGNILLWSGLACLSGALWLVPVVSAFFALEYHAIVRWEEGLLEARLGDAYRRYAANVPRWVPRSSRVRDALRHAAPHPWRDTLFSERGTLLALAAMLLLLWAKKMWRP